MLHVLLRVFTVLRCRGRARTFVDTSRSARRVSFASPEKHARWAAFFTPATCAPLAQLRVLRGTAEKTLRGPRRSTRYTYHDQYTHRSNNSPGMHCLCCLRWGTLAGRPLARYAVRGVRRRWGNERAPDRAAFSRLRSDGEWPQRSAGRFLREGASTARTAQHLGSPEGGACSISPAWASHRE